MSELPKPTSRLAIAFAWLLVMIPLGWGVYQSVVKSLPLFDFTAAKQPLPSETPK